MRLIHPPKRWAYLIATGPASIVVGLSAFTAALIGLPFAALYVLWLALNTLALPCVIIGTCLDVGVVESETGIGQKRWVWALFALFLAPFAGTVYLWTRRKYFDTE